ncbi:acetyl transferase [Bifidobacterium italicum]|uniref:Acetyl transferase n=1 Tax=Bifidobacterium italicum TaxID=1960968 RepID=A0A2A2EEJ8_9BIFI|nr:GNAT family N-acetyltransferase [Bifidobacterium italicum]PAU67629.1 acetyl transferase [Bifidobacterium italicum]
MGSFERIKNLLRTRRAVHQPPAHPAGTVLAAHPAAAIDIRPVETQMEADEVRASPSEQIEHGWDDCLPQPLAHDDDAFRPTLIGAWGQDGLIAGAFVMPDEQTADAFMANGVQHAAQMTLRAVAVTQGIAFTPEHRREGVGLKIKRFCDAWAAQHHACLMPAVITAHEALGLNEKTGHHILPTDVVPVIQIHDDATGTGCLIDLGPRDQTAGHSQWSIGVIGQTHGLTVHLGQYGATEDPPRGPDDITWTAHIGT